METISLLCLIFVGAALNGECCWLVLACSCALLCLFCFQPRFCIVLFLPPFRFLTRTPSIRLCSQLMVCASCFLPCNAASPAPFVIEQQVILTLLVVLPGVGFFFCECIILRIFAARFGLALLVSLAFGWCLC
jgi:hypothetical protein